ncbi:MAG: dihydropteroate synthase [Betaproteobacteria bacterium]|nr:dihydropteroate synthase [Betaproteobacteria bacterium]
MIWQTSRFDIDLTQPRVMGIVNLTPDSFSDGGRHASTEAGLRHAEQLLREGAHMLDVGGESTRPGSPAVPAELEWARIEGFLREAVRWNVPISVDTYKAEIMRAALDVGVDIVNDVWALQQAGSEAVVASHPRCGICLMHMHRDPQTMQKSPMQGDVLPQVADFLAARAQGLRQQGVAAERIVLDYGIGFGKTVAQNFSLLARQQALLALGYPLLAGWSRKSSLGAVLACDGQARAPHERQFASVAAALMAVERGARVVRVHDVRATVDALAVWQHTQAQDAP